MKCNDYRLLMMGALYDEISKENRSSLDSHLKSCEECRAKYLALKATSQTLEKWEDVDPNVNLTFVTQPASPIADIVNKLKSWKIGLRLGLAVAAVLLLLSIINMRVQITDGQFAFETSLFRRSAQPVATETVTQTDLENLRKENYQIVAAILDEYSKRNRIETAMLLKDFYNDFNQRRQTDLKLVSNTVEQMYSGTEQRMDRTDRALGTLIQYVNMQNQSR